MNSSVGSPGERIIVALDVPTRKEAFHLVALLAPAISIFKVGLQLYTAEGPDLVRAILDTGAKVFLDLKLHDIPNTVARAVESADRLGVQMLTIHLSGGAGMIEAAMAARKESLLILGVTVLTSIDREALRVTGIESEVGNWARAPESTDSWPVRMRSRFCERILAIKSNWSFQESAHPARMPPIRSAP